MCPARLLLLFLLAAPALLQADAKDMERSIQSQRAQLKDLRRQLAAGRARVRALEGQARRQTDAVAQIRANEQLAQTVLQRLDQTEAQYRHLLETSSSELDQARTDYTERQRILALRVRRIWMRGRPDPGLAWLGQDNTDAWLRRRKAFQAVVDADTRLLGQVRRRGDVLKDRVQSHRRRVIGLQEVEAQKQEELAVLGKNRAGQEAQLASTQDRAMNERIRLKKLEASQAAVTGLIQKLLNRRLQEQKRDAELEAKRAAMAAKRQQWEEDQKKRARKLKEQQLATAKAKAKGEPPPKVAEAEPPTPEPPPPPPPPAPKKQAARDALPQGPAPARRGMCWPIHGQILSRFGLQKNEVLGTTTRNLGIEISGSQGQSVVAASGGKVAAIIHLPGRGTTLVIEHPGGYYTLYGHLSGVMVHEGADIKACHEVARVGSDESDKGPMLYFELRKGLSALDPMEWLNR